MIFVVDTNIIFSALLNPYSSIGKILISASEKIEFCAPEMLKAALEKYENKIEKYLKIKNGLR